MTKIINYYLLIFCPLTNIRIYTALRKTLKLSADGYWYFLTYIIFKFLILEPTRCCSCVKVRGGWLTCERLIWRYWTWIELSGRFWSVETSGTSPMLELISAVQEHQTTKHTHSTDLHLTALRKHFKKVTKSWLHLLLVSASRNL